MKRLLLITGDLATGKSTFAEILSQRYNCTAFYKDKIKEILGDTVGFANREENLKLSRATMEFMMHNFAGIAHTGAGLILEANFRQSEMERLHSLAAENGYDVLTLVLRGEVNILYKRFVNRITDENRHPVHLSGFNSFDSFKLYIETSRKEKTFGRAIEITADDFSYQKDGDLLSKVDIFMGKGQ